MPDVVCVASWNADLVSRVPRPIARGETLPASSFEISPGGKSSNAAVACARQGAATALTARIGRDDFGRMGLVPWQHEGIATQHGADIEHAARRANAAAALSVTGRGAIGGMPSASQVDALLACR